MPDTCSLSCYAQELVLSTSDVCFGLVGWYLSAFYAFALGDLETRCNEQVAVRKYVQWCLCTAANMVHSHYWEKQVSAKRNCPLEGGRVCVRFVRERLLLRLLSLSAFLLQNRGRVSEPEKLLRNTCDDLPLCSLKSPKSRKQPNSLAHAFLRGSVV